MTGFEREQTQVMDEKSQATNVVNSKVQPILSLHRIKH